jgi:site-specific DNA recombinase
MGGERVNMKAFLVARVSSKEQEDNNSIPSQVRRLQDYANKHGFTDVAVYQLVESSTKANRVKLNEIISEVRQSGSEVALVTDTVDRLQRSYRESVTFDDLRIAGKLQLHFLREGLVVSKTSNSAEILRWDMGVLFAKSYVTQLSDNVKRSFEQKREQGEYPHKAPFGYKNITRDSGLKWIVPDGANAVAVRDAFALYSTGLYSLDGILGHLENKYAVSIARSHIHRILKNPFYMGKRYWQGEFLNHSYEPLVEEKVYFKVKEIIEGYREKPHRWGGIPFQYRGLISCSHCNCRISFERKNKSDKTYILGRCSQYHGKHGAKYINENKVTETLSGVFKSIELPENVIKKVAAELEKQFDNEIKTTEDSSKKIESDIEKIKNRIDRVNEDYWDGKINEEYRDEKVKEYDEKIKKLEKRKITFEPSNKNRLGDALYLLNLARNAEKLFKKANNDQKKEMVNLVLSNLELEVRELRWEYRNPFQEFTNYHNHNSWLGWRDLNPRSWDQNPLPYHLATP